MVGDRCVGGGVRVVKSTYCGGEQSLSAHNFNSSTHCKNFGIYSSEAHQAKICLRSMFGQRRPRSDCGDAQSDQGLRCPLTKSLDTRECINGEQMPG